MLYNGSRRAKIREFPTISPPRALLSSPVESPVDIQVPGARVAVNQGEWRWKNEGVGPDELVRRAFVSHVFAICGGGSRNGNTHLGADREQAP